MTFKRTAARWRKLNMDFARVPYEFVKRQMAKGTYLPSYTSSRLEKGIKTPEEDFIVKWTAQSLYAGGADTVRYTQETLMFDGF